jgi:hypothetical protein
MEKLTKTIAAIDYVGAVAGIAWGLYTKSYLWTGLGVAGLGVAWYSPSTRLNVWLKRKFLSRTKISPGDDISESVASPASAPQGHEMTRKEYGFLSSPNIPIQFRVTVHHFHGIDSFQKYALYVARTFGPRR